MASHLSPEQHRFVERLERTVLDEVERSASLVPPKDLLPLVEQALDSALDQLRQRPPTDSK